MKLLACPQTRACTISSGSRRIVRYLPLLNEKLNIISMHRMTITTVIFSSQQLEFVNVAYHYCLVFRDLLKEYSMIGTMCINLDIDSGIVNAN